MFKTHYGIDPNKKSFEQTFKFRWIHLCSFSAELAKKIEAFVDEIEENKEFQFSKALNF